MIDRPRKISGAINWTICKNWATIPDLAHADTFWICATHRQDSVTYVIYAGPIERTNKTADTLDRGRKCKASHCVEAIAQKDPKTDISKQHYNRKKIRLSLCSIKLFNQVFIWQSFRNVAAIFESMTFMLAQKTNKYLRKNLQVTIHSPGQAS